MDEVWKQQKAQRALPKPAALKAYEQQLKVAAMWQGRLERHIATPPMLPITVLLQRECEWEQQTTHTWLVRFSAVSSNALFS
jgi:hypothetical protein